MEDAGRSGFMVFFLSSFFFNLDQGDFWLYYSGWDWLCFCFFCFGIPTNVQFFRSILFPSYTTVAFFLFLATFNRVAFSFVLVLN